MTNRVQRRLRMFALLLAGLGLLAALPGQPISAQSSQTQVIDNTQGDFTNGVFQRSAIGPDLSTIASTPADSAGAVQLAPAGVLKPWEALPTVLPQAVASAGVTAIGSRLYVVGGSATGGYTDAAYWATIDPVLGALKETSTGSGQYWTNSPMAAAVANTDSVDCNAPTSQRTRAGVASVAKTSTSGFLYVVGGNVDIANCTERLLSTPLVQLGSVADNGAITWTKLADMPSPLTPDDGTTAVDTRKKGVEGAAVVALRTGAGKYYLYVIGGRSISINKVLGGISQRTLKTVFYSEINISNGSLKNPTSGSTTDVWARAQNIPLVNSANEGLWGATASAAQVSVGGGTTTTVKDAIFLAGGAHDVTATAGAINPYVYRASVNASTGALTWSTPPNTVGSDQVSLAGRIGMTSLSYNNKLYLIGGQTANAASAALSTVPTSFIDDNVNLLKIAGGSDFFVGTDNADSVLPSKAYNTGAALVLAEPPANVPPGTTLNSAWAYVIGGNNVNGVLTNAISRGKIGGDEANDTVRTPDGWYYSSVINTTINGRLARVLSIRWVAQIDRAANTQADIRIEFRKTVTASGLCPDDSVFTNNTEDRWRAIDGDTTSGFFSKTTANGAPFNVVSMKDIFNTEEINATCLQYRAHLLQNGLNPTAIPSPATTPKLLSVNLEKIIAGNADIQIPGDGFSVTTRNGRINSFVARVRNLNNNDLTNTLSVDDARGTNEGSFFVNLCIAFSAPGQPIPSLTLPSPNSFRDSDKVTCPAYATIFSYEMPKGADINLRGLNPIGETRWKSNTNNAPLDDVLSLFSTPGNYRIGLVIDAYNFVPEGTAGEANNRGETTESPNGRTIAFTVTGPPQLNVFMPFISR